MNNVWLGIDTSNYTTSVSAFFSNGDYLNLKKILDVKSNSIGVRQSDAVFMHVKNLPILFKELNETLSERFHSGYTIKAVGVSSRPRPIEGSYMPCFLSGVSVAASISSVLSVPCYEFSHQEGHVRAALFSSGDKQLQKFYSFHLSGGTCELLETTKEHVGYSFKIISSSADITLGQLVDRIGVALGLGFPSGKELETLSEHTNNFSKIKITGTDKINISGFENIAKKMINDGFSREEVASYVYSVISKVIEKMLQSRQDLSLPVLFSGGVSGSKRVQNSVKHMCLPMFSEPDLSSDNAVGIALLTKEKFEKVN